MKLRNAQLELFNHVNTVMLTFILRAREGKYNVQSDVDVLIKAVSRGVSSEHDNKRL